MGTTTQQVGIREKLSYALLTLGNIPIMVLINSFLLIFYTDVIGLNPAAVGTLFLVSRFFDAANDPIIGYILDHRKISKGGRFRPVLMLFGVLAALNFLLLWFAGVWSPVGKLVIVYIIYLLFSITFSVLDISGNSILAVITQNRGDRDTLSVVKGACQILGGTIVSVLAPIILGSASSPIVGYYYLIIGAAVVISLFTVVGAKGVKERVVPHADAEKYKVKDMLRILTYRPLLAVFLLYLATGLGSSFQTSVNAFYFTYVIGDLTVMGVVMGCGIIGMLIALVLAKFLLSKFGKKKVALFSVIMLTLGCLIRLIDPISIPLQIAGTVVSNVGLGLFTSTLPAMLSDNADAVSDSMGFRAEGAIFSISSFIAKITMGVGGAIPGYVFAAVGYQAGAAAQSSGVNNAIIMMLLVLPIVFYVISGLTFGFAYKINDKPQQNQ
jgi:GPH family glycoside/pentoside/hexuronide:cation symporter/glucuronide carrier protein